MIPGEDRIDVTMAAQIEWGRSYIVSRYGAVPPKRLAYAWLPSFRRERGGLYAAYVAIYSRVYQARMRRLHGAGRHGRLMANGRCTWCGERG